METKYIKEVIQAALDEYCDIVKIKKISVKNSDIENRIKNPCCHDDFIDVNASFKEKIGMKIFCSLVDYLKIV